eukprot:GHVP01054325.1.p1 GENE.GHVP01054325.1~~GHVP01054325.1.p1  ORF type:complete len:387 (+),score=121.81 GHVP01054325.1:1680-2840(+)
MGVVYREYDMKDVEKKADEAISKLKRYNEVSDISYCPINVAGIVNSIRLLTESSRCYTVVGAEESDDEEETMRQYEDEDGSIDLEKLNRHYNMARLISIHHKRLQSSAAELRDCVQDLHSIDDPDLASTVENTISIIDEFIDALSRPSEAIKAMNAERKKKRMESRKMAMDSFSGPKSTAVDHSDHYESEPHSEEESVPRPRATVSPPKDEYIQEHEEKKERRKSSPPKEEEKEPEEKASSPRRGRETRSPPKEEPNVEESKIEEVPVEETTPTKARRGRETRSPQKEETAPVPEEVLVEEAATPTKARRSRETRSPPKEEQAPAPEAPKVEEAGTPTKARRGRESRSSPKEEAAPAPEEPKVEEPPAEEPKAEGTPPARARRGRR